MNTITQISATGLKGGAFSHQLGPVTLVTGNSMSGKTRVLDAIRLALLGYHPEVGKQASRVMELAAGNELSVCASVICGNSPIPVTVSRRWQREGQKCLADSDALPFIEPMSLDFREFVNLTAVERAQLVFRAAGDSAVQISVSQFAQRIRMALEDEKTDKALISEIEMIFEKIDAARQEEDATVQQFLELLVAELKATAKAARQEADTLEKGIQSSVLQPSEPARNVETELAAARETLTWLTVKLATARELQRQAAQPDSSGATADMAKEIMWQKSRCEQAGRVRQGLRDEAAKTDELKCCPFCKSKGKGWRDSLQDDIKRRLTEADAVFHVEHEAMTALLKRQEQLQAQSAAAAKVSTDDHVKLIADLTVERATAALSVTGLEHEQKQYVASQSRKAAQLQTRARADAAQKRATAFKTAQTTAEKVLKLAVDASVAKLMETANLFTNQILKGPLVYESGDIGYKESGSNRFISMRGFSGTEKALAFVAMCVALCQSSKLKLVMIDELGIMDTETKRNVIKRMFRLQANRVIDQFVGCDVSGAWAADLPGLTIIRV